MLLFAFSVMLRAGEVTITPMSAGETAKFFNDVAYLVIGQESYEGNTSLAIYNDLGVVIQTPVKVKTKITFEGSPEQGLNEVVATSSNISFYPNPAKDVINIVGLEEPTTAKLYTLNGMLVLTTTETNINVSGLTEGNYVLQVGSQCFKVLIR